MSKLSIKLLQNKQVENFQHSWKLLCCIILFTYFTKLLFVNNEVKLTEDLIMNVPILNFPNIVIWSQIPKSFDNGQYTIMDEISFK